MWYIHNTLRSISPNLQQMNNVNLCNSNLILLYEVKLTKHSIPLSANLHKAKICRIQMYGTVNCAYCLLRWQYIDYMDTTLSQLTLHWLHGHYIDTTLTLHWHYIELPISESAATALRFPPALQFQSTHLSVSCIFYTLYFLYFLYLSISAPALQFQSTRLSPSSCIFYAFLHISHILIALHFA